MERAPLARPTATAERLVSTIIPVYNRPGLLQEAVASVLAQDHRPIEVLIVDDGSTDETGDVAEALARAEPDVVRAFHIENGGPGLAREVGRRAARGAFIQYLDSDDLLLPGKFRRQLAALEERTDCGVAYGKTRFYRLGERPGDGAWKRTGEKIATMFPAFLQSRWWGTSTPLYRRAVTDAIGPWTGLRNEEDWEYDCRIAALGIELCFCDAFVSDQRQHDGMRLSDGGSIDVGKLADRARAHGLILGHAWRAGIDRDAPEMRHFARELFLLARQCGAAGLAPQAKGLFRLAREASEPKRRDGWDFKFYGALAGLIGWGPSRSAGLPFGQFAVMSPPLVSVVMSVYNDAERLAKTLGSILDQEGVELEFIVIDDGSTDETGRILDDWARRDPRLRVVHQENRGLTRALIRGCKMARGTYIARQDGGGDVSLPGRLAAQVAVMENEPGAVAVSCGTRYLGPAGEVLTEVVRKGDEIQETLEDLYRSRKQGPSCHPSVLLLRVRYEEAGGYRPAFRVGQDLDLWLRMAEIGRFAALPQVFYETRLSSDSISANHRRAQGEALKTVTACGRCRRTGQSDDAVLARLSARRRPPLLSFGGKGNLQAARFHYFVAGMLKGKRPKRARYYYLKATRSWWLAPRVFLAMCIHGMRK